MDLSATYSILKTLGVILVAVAGITVLIFLQKGSEMEKTSFPSGVLKVIELPSILKEISGLAFSPDERLFAHNDEKGMIAEIDVGSGRVKKTFFLGRPAVREDFEDIAIVGDRFFLVTSSGVLYECPEGDDGSAVEFIRYKTHLNAGNDVEGLCFDPVRKTILFACKGSPGNGMEGVKAVYEYSLEKMELAKAPRFIIPEKKLLKKQARGFAPSAMTYHKAMDCFFLLSSRAQLLVILTPDGTISGVYHLPKNQHPQPEGIAFHSDGRMLISDEGPGGKQGAITIYESEVWKKWKQD